MKYIIATTDNKYFRWQILVQINNFKKLGIIDDVIYIVSYEKSISKEIKLIEKETGVKFYYYKDTRKNKIYTSSVRPHILAKHFKKYSVDGGFFMYLDPDVLFREKLNINDAIKNTKSFFVSDTKSYINSKYIKGKSPELFERMCEVANIESSLVENNDNGAGGAQYIMKNIDHKFWKEVEKDCVNLYELMMKTEKEYSPKHPIQKWTADMWAVLWNIWKLNIKTIILKDLSFSWATSHIKSYDQNLIFHNAGVFNEKDLFNKCKFTQKTPFFEDFSYVNVDRCSYNYVREILETKKNYPNLIKQI